MEQVNDLLGYSNLKIVQNDEWFKFSLDSVLLSNFTTINLRCTSIIDLCTGNAPIPLILSTRTNKKIIGVELQKDIYELALKSIDINNLSKQISIINEDVRNLEKIYGMDKFDLVTCNPPYFKVGNNSITNFNDIKALARHEISLNLDDIFLVSSKILKIGGIISMVHRPERFIEIITSMRKYGIEPKRVKFVYPKNGKDANILLIEGIKGGKVGVKIESPLYIYDDNNNYTHELKHYINL